MRRGELVQGLEAHMQLLRPVKLGKVREQQFARVLQRLRQRPLHPAPKQADARDPVSTVHPARHSYVTGAAAARTKWKVLGILTCSVRPPPVYSLKPVVSPMLNEYGLMTLTCRGAQPFSSVMPRISENVT